jgi:hypothetical protein
MHRKIRHLLFLLAVCNSTEEGLQPGGLADKSLWGIPDMLRESVDKSRSNSGDSESAVRPSLPNSRSSSINNGMSAPNSSQGSRNHTLNSLRVPANKSMSSNTGIGAGNTGFEYGHDFFTGHWAESKPFVGSYDASVESSKANTGRDESGGIFFMDGNTAMDGTGQRQPQRRAGEHVFGDLMLILQLSAEDLKGRHNTNSFHGLISPSASLLSPHSTSGGHRGRHLRALHAQHAVHRLRGQRGGARAGECARALPQPRTRGDSLHDPSGSWTRGTLCCFRLCCQVCSILDA